MNRTTHELLTMAETLGAWAKLLKGKRLWSAERADGVFEQATLYDEHTWGGFASIERPQDRWVKAQWNRKSGYAYTASSEAHDMVARGAAHLAGRVGMAGPEGMFNLGDPDPKEAYPTPHDDYVLVINTLPDERAVTVDEPEIRGGAAPVGVLDCFFPRHVSWGGQRPASPVRKISSTVPGYGFAFLPTGCHPDSSDLRSQADGIENAAYRSRIDESTGAVSELVDLETGHDYAGSYEGYGVGQYVHEWVDSPDQRNALFIDDLAAEDFGTRIRDTPFRREGATEVVLNPPATQPGEVSITVDIKTKGVREARCTYRLRSGIKSLRQ